MTTRDNNKQQQPLFDLPAPVQPPLVEDLPAPPAWVGKGLTKAQRLNVARGLHPMGRRLGPEGKTCGICRHKVKRRQAGAWHKCALDRQNWTSGKGSDIRVRWRACDQFESDGIPF